MTQSGMMFCDYEGTVCVGANAYVDNLLIHYEYLCWGCFIAGMVAGFILGNMVFNLIKYYKGH